MTQITILTKKEVHTEQATIQSWKIELPLEPRFLNMRAGFDCGTTHIGLAVIEPIPYIAKLYQIDMVRSKDAMQRIKDIQRVLYDCQLYFTARFEVIIEGSAYSKNYRQTELAEIRTSAALWFDKYGGEVHFVAPNSIRKQVFGDGLMKAQSFWQSDEIGNDALAALACAFYLHK